MEQIVNIDSLASGGVVLLKDYIVQFAPYVLMVFGSCLAIRFAMGLLGGIGGRK